MSVSTGRIGRLSATLETNKSGAFIRLLQRKYNLEVAVKAYIFFCKMKPSNCHLSNSKGVIDIVTSTQVVDIEPGLTMLLPEFEWWDFAGVGSLEKTTFV